MFSLICARVCHLALPEGTKALFFTPCEPSVTPQAMECKYHHETASRCIIESH
ncbi:hypothetical protein TNIN_189351, partial [Trichonephila inaurata madagascariensis]